jgi:hypothetical protein
MVQNRDVRDPQLERNRLQREPDSVARTVQTTTQGDVESGIVSDPQMMRAFAGSSDAQRSLMMFGGQVETLKKGQTKERTTASCTHAMLAGPPEWGCTSVSSYPGTVELLDSLNQQRENRLRAYRARQIL